jgi:hypothetical protein
MDSIFHRARIFPLIVFSISLVFLTITPAYPLIVPPDPFESTDRFALLSPAPDGSITLVQAKVKTPGPDPLGAGELRALLQYKLPPPHRRLQILLCRIKSSFRLGAEQRRFYPYRVRFLKRTHSFGGLLPDAFYLLPRNS